MAQHIKFRWSLAQANPLFAETLARGARISPLLAQCLLNRGLRDLNQVSGFLGPRLMQLSDPFLVPNMAEAVARLCLARDRNEPLVIFGDYDVDGVTATVLLQNTLEALGWSVQTYLPHRIEEGYGLSQEAVENCLRKFPAKLLLAVDCGSNAVDCIGWLRGQGVDVFVLDHHQCSSPLPPACALVNPQLARRVESADGSGQDGQAAFADLCSVGLAFKMAHALVKHGRAEGWPAAVGFDLRPLLDLVAVGTIADLVPLTGENRVLVSAGLERLNSTRRPGFVALKQVAKCPDCVGTHEVGFQLGPRLNAAGRLETAETSLRLLRSADLAEALPLAQALDSSNRDRQQIERGISQTAIGAVLAKFRPETDFVVVEGQPGWHIGVIGIVASRVLQQFYRPTIILGGDGDEWRGSGRSVPGFDLAAALRECEDLLVRHGGHAMAAGLTIERRNVDAFRSRLNEIARSRLTAEALHPPLRLDAEVGLEELTLDCIAHLGQLHPIGQGNPSVHFLARNLSHQRPLQRIGHDKQHVKMWVSDGNASHQAVWWGAGNEALPVGLFDLAFVPQINEYNNQRQVQLKVLDWRQSANP